MSTSKGGSELVDLGDGDYEVDASTYGDNDAVSVNFASMYPESILTLVFTSVNGTSVGFVTSTYGDLTTSVGMANLIVIDASQIDILTNYEGCLAVMVDTKFVARVAIRKTSPMQTVLSVPLPLYARGDDGDPKAMTLQGRPTWAGWQTALPAGGVVRLTGFNLPRLLTSYTGATPTTINAEGGDYGIEFAIPGNSDSVAIFDETFWLYIR